MIIGFVGKKGSGKTTAAKYLISQVPGIVHINFKDELIAEIQKYLPKVVDELIALYKVDSEGKPLTPDTLFSSKPAFPLVRALMQNWGTELRRAEDEDYWVKKYKAKVLSLPAATHVVTDDVRFMNEARTVRELDGDVIRLARKDEDVLSDDTHQSETEMETIVTDYTIFTGPGDIGALHNYLRQVILDISQK